MACVIVIGGYAPSLVNFRKDLLKSLVSLGHTVIACAPGASDETIGELEEMGVDYCDIPVSRTGLNPLEDIRTFFALLSLFRKERPDAVLAYTIKPVIYGSLAAKVASVPAVFSMITGLGNAFVAEGFKSKLIRVLVSYLYRNGLTVNKQVFFQNPDDLVEFKQRGLLGSNDKGVLINGSGINTHTFQVHEMPLTIRFLLIARLLKDKGVCEYAQAASIIKTKYPEVEFDLVGWLDENPACISESQLNDWINTGTVNYLGKLDDVKPAIISASVYVLPSYREGTPRTVLEAMAMGRPIITTDAPGCKETVIDGENGFLVPVKSVDELVAAMEKFILNPELIVSMGKRSREMAEDKYDVHKVNQVILETMELL
ncbi:MAG: glycosyltransferase family 4 protein [Gammaproteobacteria bacterium]|nr:glycosyltransferase family 4 protein [Gammaproteobacteria bacterium]